MMHLEYNWTASRYQPRFGHTFIDVRGERGWDTLAEARAALERAGLRLGRKTDSRTWTIETGDSTPWCNLGKTNSRTWRAVVPR